MTYSAYAIEARNLKSLDNRSARGHWLSL